MIYTITSTLPENHGGRTKALLRRIAFLQEEENINQTILTTNYNPDYPHVLETFKARGILKDETKVINIYDWLSGFQLFNIPEKTFRKQKKYQKQPVNLENVVEKANKKGDVLRYYDQKTGDYLMYRKFYPDSDVVMFDDIMTNEVKHKIIRYEYNRFGYLHKKTQYSPHANIKIAEEMYDLHGNVYCQKFFDRHQVNQPFSILTFDQGRVMHAFKSDDELFAYFYQQHFEDGDIVFNDARLLDEALLNVTHAISRVMVFHSSHLANGEIKGSFRNALYHPEKVSKYLVLTQHQKDEIQQATGIQDRQFSVIPHFIEPTRRHHHEPKDQFIYVGRFSPEKQIPHIIKAFKKFKEKGYKTKLKLYGGVKKEERSEIQQFVDEYGLQDEVEIHPFTHGPGKVFRQSRASILASNKEGFGLTVMESINEGCPAISYDVRYGPREIIDSGENGYIVEPNHIDGLADAMVKIAEEPLDNVTTKHALTPESAKQNYKQLFLDIKHESSRY